MTKAETLKAQEFDFQKDLAINKYRLDEECLAHASRYAFYAEAQAAAKTNVSKAKDNLELVESEANLRIRKNFAASGTKVTENIVACTISQDAEVMKAKEALREAEEVYGRLSVAVNAMDVKRSELDNLVKLYCAGYFSVVNSDGGMKHNSNDRASMEARKNLNRGE